jgi:hypothetical protein
MSSCHGVPNISILITCIVHIREKYNSHCVWETMHTQCFSLDKSTSVTWVSVMVHPNVLKLTILTSFLRKSTSVTWVPATVHTTGNVLIINNCKFHFREKYEGHMSSSHGAPKRHVCQLCGKQFALNSDLYKHRAQVGDWSAILMADRKSEHPLFWIWIRTRWAYRKGWREVIAHKCVLCKWATENFFLQQKKNVLIFVIFLNSNLNDYFHPVRVLKEN